MTTEPSGGDADWSGSGFVPRTLRSAAVVAGIVLLVLASYGQFWAIGPFLTGLGLSSLLLWAWDVFVRGLMQPRSSDTTKVNGKRRGGWAIIVFSLIKYPLVGLMLYVAVRLWRGDTYHALAFLGGFILLHLVIG